MIHKLNVLFLTLASRSNSEGSPIYCRITLNGQRKDFATGIRVHTTAWDQTKQRIKTKDGGSVQSNERLQQIRYDLNNVLQQLVHEGNPFDASDIIHRVLHPDDAKPKTLVEAFEAKLDALRKMLGKGIVQETIRHYETSYNNVKRFIVHKYGRKDILLARVYVNMLLLYEEFLRAERSQRQVTTNKQIQRLKNVVRYALIQGWLPTDPFIGHRFKSTQAKVIYLTSEELQRLSSHQIAQERLSKVRDMFLFSVYTGLHYNDAALLTCKHIVQDGGEEWVVYVRPKTDREIWIPFLPQAKAMLERLSRYTDGTHLLPRISNQKFNSYIKEVADIVGIDKEVTHKVARKTWASTVLLGNNVPMAVVSELCGHQSIKITQEHYARVDRSILSAEMKRVAASQQSGKQQG